MSTWSQDELKQVAATDDLQISPLRDDGVTDGPLLDRVGEAYQAKYRGSAYLGLMIGVRARAATLKVMPATAGSA